ncbi:hypothetical protein EDD15DRAFT_2391272 [Pisolithus albus]|nr:hypothetical protein EDD15DRAFT_2391272 [Pisolithus albus]
MPSKLPQSQCDFTCPSCFRVLKNRSGLTQHIIHTHSSSSRRPPKQKAIDREDPPPCVGFEPSLCTWENHAILDDACGNDLCAGAPPPSQIMADKNDWYPFTSCVEFETAEFLFTDNQMPQAQVDRLLQLWTASLLPFNGRPPYTDHTDLHKVIDAIPHGDAVWTSFQVQYAGDVPELAPRWMTKGYDVWFHNANAVVKNLLSNTDFHEHFDYIPYREFEPTGQRRWENFMSGNWAWHHADILAQDAAMHGAMLVPIILGSDKTTVSVATGQNDYYPLYISIGNIHNKIRRAHRNALVLLAFLAIPKTDRESEDSAEFRKFRRQLFHTTLSHILSSLKCGMSEPEVRQCPDGHFRRVAYALAAYIADYLEQVLLSCLVQGWCPLCMNMSNHLDGGNGVPRSREHAEYCIHAFAFSELWDQYGIVGDLTPFTNDFPHADIYKLLTPDLLHQIIKGVFKDHLVTWISEYLKISYGEAEANRILDDIDQRIAAVPLYPNLRRFPEGRRFKQWTGDDSKALMKVYLPAIEGHVPPGVVRTVSAFLEFCYTARRNSLNESAIESLQQALDRFHHHRQIFQQTGVREQGPKGFSLPRQHSMTHYRHLIQEFGAPNGLCSSITESKHIKAVKKPWRRSNRFNALGQMLITNQRLDKLAAARVDFENRQMLQGSVLSATIRDAELHGGVDNGSDGDSGSEGSGTDDHESETQDSPRVLNYVRLAKTPARKFPSDIHALAHHIQQPKLPQLTSHFLQFQLQDDTNPSNDDAALPDLSNSPVSVFHSAVSTFYAPSDLSGLGGMHTERIRSTPCWRKGHPRYDTGLPFFSFTYGGVKYPCALIQWFSTISDGPDDDTGMWVVQPDLDADGQRELGVVHLHSVLRGAHLIPVYGHDRLPTDIQHTDSLDIFQAYYVNKYIDHHAFEIAF